MSSLELQLLLDAPWHDVSVIDSTNQYLLELPSKQLTNGYTCSARSQTDGHGRHQRHWISNEGGLYLSVLFLPDHGTRQIHLLTFAAAVATADTLEDAAPGISIQLKWPNDILLDGRKIGGILCQSRTNGNSCVVVGIGINVSNSLHDLSNRLVFPATNLSAHFPDPPQPEFIAKRLRQNLMVHYLKWKSTPEQVVESWCGRDIALNRQICFCRDDQNIAGIYRGVLETGEICIDTVDGSRSFCNGEITHIGGLMP